MLRFSLFCIISILFSSCNNDNTENLSKNALIKSFTIHEQLYNDISFSIDQVNGFIFNQDSLPFGSITKDIRCIISTIDKVSSIKLVGENELITRSTLFDFTEPVHILVTAEDGKTTKTYQIKLNVKKIH